MNSRQSPYQFDLFTPSLTELTGSDRVFVRADLQPWSLLNFETSILGLKLTGKQEETTEGRKFSVEAWKEGVSEVEADLTYTVEDRSYKFVPTSQVKMSSNHQTVKTMDITSSGIYIKPLG